MCEGLYILVCLGCRHGTGERFINLYLLYGCYGCNNKIKSTHNDRTKILDCPKTKRNFNLERTRLDTSKKGRGKMTSSHTLKSVVSATLRCYVCGKTLMEKIFVCTEAKSTDRGFLVCEKCINSVDKNVFKMEVRRNSSHD